MKSRKLILTAPARNDLDDILDYLTAAEPLRGPRYVDRMLSHFRARAEAGLTGSQTSHIAPNTSGFIFDNYVALVRANNEHIEIIRIFHTARNIQLLLTPEKRLS